MVNASTESQKDDGKMRIQIVCSILAEVQNELKNGQKPGDATKVQAIAQKDDITEHIVEELVQTVARDNECRYDSETGLAIRIVDGQVIEANAELFKKIDEQRKNRGKSIKVIRSNNKSEIDRG